jgi:hypothetical protein
MPITPEEQAALDKAAEDKAAAEKAAAEEAKKGEGAPKFTMEQVAAGMQYLHNENKALKNELTVLKTEVGKKPAPARGDDDDVNLETMTRQEYANYILKQAESRLVDPVKAEQAADVQKRDRDEAKRQIDAAAGKHGDFWEFREEMKSIVNELPDINIEDAYVLAKSRNPDKASLVDERIAKKKKEEKKEEEKKEDEPKYGGLLPTSTTSKRSSTMKPDEAAEAAWSETGAGEHLRALTNN